MLRRSAVGCALLILSTAALMAAEGFDADAKALQKTLQADTLQASDLPPFEDLLKAAGTDAQRATAHLLLAQALQKASQYERASNEWKAYADLQRRINQPAIGPSVCTNLAHQLPHDFWHRVPAKLAKLVGAATD